MILKISLGAKAGVPKTLVQRKLRLHSMHLSQNTLMSLAGNSVIYILILDFVGFAIPFMAFELAFRRFLYSQGLLQCSSITSITYFLLIRKTRARFVCRYTRHARECNPSHLRSCLVGNLK